MLRLVLRTLAAILVVLPFATVGFLALFSPTTSVVVVAPADPWLLTGAALFTPILAGLVLWFFANRMEP